MTEADTMTPNAAFIQAGALLPAGSPLPADARVDAVDARRYQHPGIGDRVVIRLVNQLAAEGADQEMRWMGFANVGAEPAVALRQRQALGFPAWVLVYAPAQTKLAMELMKEFEKQAKQAFFKPGLAREGFQALAQRLQPTPQLLPSFWEEVGRAFIAAGNTTYAASFFDLARAAEASFGLPIEPEQRAEVFLEFALAGALNVRAIQGYTKELVRTFGADEAFTRFFQLCVQRTASGRPPWASMAKDLRGLAKGAKRDTDVEEERFLDEVLGSQGAVTAPLSFWRDYEAALLRLCARSASARGRLLNLLPRPKGNAENLVATWLSLLSRAGCLDGLWDQAAPADAQPLGGAAGWFSRWIQAHSDALFLPLLRQCAPRLIAEAQPLRLTEAHSWASFPVDLLDLALELGLPVAPPDPEQGVDLVGWAAGPAPRDPVFLAADPRFARLFEDAVAENMGALAIERASAGKQAFVGARHRWLLRTVERLTDGGLPDLSDMLEIVAHRIRPEMLAEFPDVRVRLESADPANNLLRTLQIGILDEYAWPAFEQAVQQCGAQPLIQVCLPYTFVASPHRLFVIGPDDVRAFDLALPKDMALSGFAWAGDQPLVVYHDESWNHFARWPGQEPFSLSESYTLNNFHRLCIPVGNGTSEGGRALFPGDNTLSAGALAFWDGQQVWRVEGAQILSVNPRTGAAGEQGRPAFFSGVTDLVAESCWLHPLPAAWAGSPLGGRDGLYGLRVAGKPPELVTETLDGRRFVGVLGDSARAPGGLLRVPGADAPRPFLVTYGGWHEKIWSFELFSPDGRFLADRTTDPASRAWAMLPPPGTMHALVPRDPAGSAALRALDLTTARKLMTGTPLDDAAALARVRAVLPAITDPGLQKAVAGQVAWATKLGATLQARGAAVAVAVAPSANLLADEEVYAALGVLGLEDCWESGDFGGHLTSAAAFLEAGGPVVRSAAPSTVRWDGWPEHLLALAFLAVAPETDEAQRATLQTILRLWAESWLGAGSDDLRRVTLIVDRADAPILRWEQQDGARSLPLFWAHEEPGQSRYLIWQDSGEDEPPFTLHVLERKLGAAFTVPNGCAVAQAEPLPCPARRAWIQAFLTELAARGPRPWTPAEVEQLATATGLGRTEALLLLVGLPNIHLYSTDFLGKERRERLGLKVGEARAGQGALRDLPVASRWRVLAAAMPADPAALWDAEQVARLADAWNREIGQRITISEEVRHFVTRELRLEIDAPKLLAALGAPERTPVLQEDRRIAINGYGEVEPVTRHEDGFFSASWIFSLSVLLPALAPLLPIGDPLRAQLRRLHQLALARLRFEELLVETGTWYYENNKKKEADRLLSGIGGTVEVLADEDATRVDNGVLVVVQSEGSVSVTFRPARLSELTPALEKILVVADPEPLATVRALLDPTLAEVLSDDPSWPAGRYTTDPRVVAPALVAEVEAALGVSHDAATLYLQILALPQPTSRDVQRWNGWTAATYRKAAAALVAAGRVVEAKRARAGRDHFLPGGWHTLPAPDLPIETWKLGLYGVNLDKHHAPIVVREPMAKLFARAWAQRTDG